MSNTKSAIDLQETVRRLGTSMSERAGETSSRLKDYWQNLNPEARASIVRGLTGAAIGGGITGSLAALTPRDPEESKTKAVVNSALLGSLLGGVGAVGFPIAEKMFAGQLRFPSEKGKSLTSKVIDTGLSPIIHNPLTAAGGALGAGAYYNLTQPYVRTLYPKGPGIYGELFKGRVGRALVKIRRAAELAGTEAGTAATAAHKVVSPAAARATRLAKFGPWAVPAGVLAGFVLDRYLKGEA